MTQSDITQAEVDRLYEKLKQEAEESGYHLNPESEFAKGLIRSLIVNEKRYGYRSCPCRLASGKKSDDLDIICPCDYRDPDLNEYDACYCALYVSEAALRDKKIISSIPERRPVQEKKNKTRVKAPSVNAPKLPLPVWRCRVCGYLCARQQPSEVCPVCKAKKERFEIFM